MNFKNSRGKQSDCKNAGITLIALIITILVLLILAGVVISFTVGNQGLISKTMKSTSKYEEEQAREKLQIELTNFAMEKISNENYNENEYLTKELIKDGYIVNGDIVIVDGYNFQINRSVPEIMFSMGKREKSNEIVITVAANNVDGNDKCVATVEIEYSGEVEKIEIAGQSKEIPKKEDGKYTLNVESTENGEQQIYVQTKDGKYNVEKYEVTGLGNLNKSGEIEISTSQNLITNSYAKSVITIDITYEGELKQIKFGGEEKEIPTKIGENKYTVTAEKTENGTYEVYVESKDEKYNKANVEVTQISENMEISSAQQLATFRDKVNAGASFAGKTVTLTADINMKDLDSGSTRVSWVPISTNNKFAGTFDGQYHKINDLYINSNAYTYHGLFMYSKGIIQNLILNNVSIYNNRTTNGSYTAAIVGCNNGGKIQYCGVNSGNITNYNMYATGSSWIFIGAAGICGNSSGGSIENCYSKANIKSEGFYGSQFSYSEAGAAGICSLINGTNIYNCYSSGSLTAKAFNAFLGGMASVSYGKNYKIEKCYCRSVSFTGTSYQNFVRSGGIVGRNGGWDASAPVSINQSYCGNATTNSSWTGNNTQVQTGRLSNVTQLKTYASTLGTTWVADGKKIDANGNVVDNKDSSGNLIYINDGYPILRWQAENL